MARKELVRDIAAVLNKHSAENNSDTPDFILAEFLVDTLVAYDQATKARTTWHKPPEPEEANENGPQA